MANYNEQNALERGGGSRPINVGTIGAKYEFMIVFRLPRKYSMNVAFPYIFIQKLQTFWY